MHYRMINAFTSLAGLAMLALSVSLMADDTEIYFVTGAEDGGALPQVMFNLEYAQNMTSNRCNGVTWDNFETSCGKYASIKHYFSPIDVPRPGQPEYGVEKAIDQFQVTRAALKRVLAELGDLKVGIMFPHAHEANCAGPIEETGKQCSGGGYVLQRMVELEKPPSGFDPLNATHLANHLAAAPNKRALFDRFDALPTPQGNLSHTSQLKEIYFELFRYLTGQKIFNAKNGWNNFGTGPNSTTNLGDWTRHASHNQGNFACHPDDVAHGLCDSAASGGRYVLDNSLSSYYSGDFVAIGTPVTHYISTYPFKWDVDAFSSNGDYYSPLEDCSRVFVINILDGSGSQQDDANNAIAKPLSEGGMGVKFSNDQKGFVEMVRWLFDKDLADGSISNTLGELVFKDKQNVTSFFIANQPQQLDAAALAGGTGMAIKLTDDPDELVQSIQSLFSQILSISTTFVSASIPVNVFNRSEVLDNAYLALFQPDGDARPFWTGNVKKLKMSIQVVCHLYNDQCECLDSENRLRLYDALNVPVITDTDDESVEIANCDTNDDEQLVSAISDTDGRISNTALTFWTDANGFDLYDDLDTEMNPPELAGRDGRSVNRGGAGQRIPGFLQGTATFSNTSGGRRLLTERSGSLVPLDWDDMNTLWPAMYELNSEYSEGIWPQAYDGGGNPVDLTGVWATDHARYTQNPTIPVPADDPTCKTSFYTGPYGYAVCYSSQFFQFFDLGANVFAYMRGFDVMDDEDGDGVVWESRRWLLGDPLHSRPLPINYGERGGHTENNPDIRILMGSNDGYLRMIRNTNADGSESGEEVWAFMPRSVMKYQKQLMVNAAGGDPVHPYGVDGPVTAYVLDSTGTIGSDEEDDVMIFFGLRRGGKDYYGMRIVDPDAPEFLWHLDPTNGDFEEMGYTFSQPVVRLLDWGEGAKPVVIVGAGYDRLNKDASGTVELGTNDQIGNAIYIINAETGDLLWKVTGDNAASCGAYCQRLIAMTDSIPSEVTAIDSQGNGLVDRLYVGDTGGNVWRVDLPGNDRTEWRAHHILKLGRHYNAALADDRRFFHAADVVPSRDMSGRYIGVVIGSGNRANPLQTHVNDAMFMYKDRYASGEVDANWPYTPNDLFDATDNCIQQVGVDCDNTVNTHLSTGWLMYLTAKGSGVGEKSLSAPLTLRGEIYFNTYIPAGAVAEGEASCGPSEGSGVLYRISLADATAVYNYDSTNTAVWTDDAGNTQEAELQIEDRYRDLRSGGIPSENVFISFCDAAGNCINTVLPPDLHSEEDLGAQQWRTYWFDQNN